MRRRSKDLELDCPTVRTVWVDGDYTVPPMFLHMFEEDVSFGVAPIGGRRHNENFRVVFSGDEREQERARTMFELLSDRSYMDDEESMAESIKRIASHLLNDGVAMFEILSAKRNNESDLFVLHPIQPQYLYRLPFAYVQFIPPRKNTEEHRRSTFVSKKRIFRIFLPGSLGGRLGYLHLRRVLFRMTGFPTFAESELSEGTFRTTYDLSEFRRLMRSTLLSATRTWGWTGRDNSLDHETEFYLVHRQLTFAWATATLRESIVEQLNHLYLRLGINSSIALHGVRQPDEILDIRKRLASGEIDFAKVFGLLNTLEN